MRNPESMLRVYEELASRFVRQNEPRFRDHCLVLAADAAMSANRPQDAERLRQRLLQLNPHHLLRPFASMAEAMQAPDVQEYVADLRRQWPPEFVQKLYLGGQDQPRSTESHATESRATEPPPAEPRAVFSVVPQAVPVPQPAPVLATPRVETVAKERTIPIRSEPVKPPRPPQAAPAGPAAPPLRVPPRPHPAPTAYPSPAGAWFATMLVLLGIAGGMALLFFALVWPLLN